MNTFGRQLRLSLFGESHGAGVGVLLDGVPAGLPVDEAAVHRDLAARRPGASNLVSQRQEADEPVIMSGVMRGRATGAPLCIWVANRDADSKSYRDRARIPRPGHADWVNLEWSKGHADLRGGGHSSGRLTAGLVAAGTIAQAILDPLGITCAAHLHQVGRRGGPINAHKAKAMRARAEKSALHTAHHQLEKSFRLAIERVRRAGDSVGGVVEFCADGLPIGLGDPWFDSMESTLSHLLFAVPAVKGVSFGAGFAAAGLRGSQHNDSYTLRKRRVTPASNHAGGVLGGRTTGAPIWGHVAVKPASSIFQPQKTMDLQTRRPTTLRLSGRHDPCIAVRAVPVVQACVAFALADAVLLGRQQGIPGTWP